MEKINWTPVLTLDKNTYGGLYVTHHNGRYYWIVENWDTDFDDINQWQEIPKSLYDEILKHLKQNNG